MHRFINADSYTSTGQGFLGTNMFAYCNNCPVRYADPSGNQFIEADEREYGGVLAYTDTASGGNFNIAPQPQIRDVTDEVNAALVKAVADGEHFGEYDYSNSLWADTEMLVEAWSNFYNLVNHNAAWDIKHGNPWENTIGTPYPGKNATVRYCGMTMTLEQLGNFTYGYLGYVYGIPLEVLLAGSWAAAGFPIKGKALKNEQLDQVYVAFGHYVYPAWDID